MEQHNHQAGFVSIIGKPNVGKSTLMNELLGERLSIITPKAQTTRHRICGIVNGPDFQIVYADTPGILTPAYALQKSMMQAVYSSLIDTDVLLWVIEVHEKEIPLAIQQKVLTSQIPILLLINKIDLVDAAELEKVVDYWTAQVQVKEILPISALHALHTHPIVARILTYLPAHPPYYPKDMLTDKPERFFAAEIIREQLLRNYRKEIPYSVEVVIESFKEETAIIRISAVIYVDKKTQKAILIGHQGASLKKVGIAARQALEQFLGKQVFIGQHVKVLPGWRNKAQLLQRFGY